MHTLLTVHSVVSSTWSSKPFSNYPFSKWLGPNNATYKNFSFPGKAGGTHFSPHNTGRMVSLCGILDQTMSTKRAFAEMHLGDLVPCHFGAEHSCFEQTNRGVLETSSWIVKARFLFTHFYLVQWINRWKNRPSSPSRIRTYELGEGFDLI